MQCVIIKLSFDSIWRYDLLTEMSKILIKFKVEVENCFLQSIE